MEIHLAYNIIQLDYRHSTQILLETNSSNITKQDKKTPTCRRQPVGYLQAWMRIWTWDDRVQSQQVAKVELKHGTATVQAQHGDHLAMLPPKVYVNMNDGST